MQYAEEFESMFVEDLVKKLQEKFDERFYLVEKPQKKFEERYNVFYKKEDNENFLQQHNPDSFNIFILKNGISCYKVNISFKDKKIRITNAYKDIEICIHNVELDSYNDVDRVVEGIYDSIEQHEHEKGVVNELQIDKKISSGYKFKKSGIVGDFLSKVKQIAGKYPFAEKVLKKLKFNVDLKYMEQLTKQFKNRLGDEFNVKLVKIPPRPFLYEGDHGDLYKILITYNINGKDEFAFTVVNLDNEFVYYQYDCIDEDIIYSMCGIVNDASYDDDDRLKSSFYISKSSDFCADVNFIADLIEKKTKERFCRMIEDDYKIENVAIDLQHILGKEFKVNLIKDNLPNNKNIHQYKAIEVLNDNGYRAVYKICHKLGALSSCFAHKIDGFYEPPKSVDFTDSCFSDKVKDIVKEDIEQFKLGNCCIHKKINIDNDIQDNNIITNEDNIINTNTDNIQIEEDDIQDNNIITNEDDNIITNEGDIIDANTNNIIEEDDIQDNSNLVNNGSDIVISSYDLESKINELKQKQDCTNDINDINDTNIITNEDNIINTNTNDIQIEEDDIQDNNIITNEEINNSSNIISGDNLSSKNNVFK